MVGVEQADNVQPEVALKPDDVRVGAVKDLQMNVGLLVLYSGKNTNTLIQDGSVKNSFKSSRSSRTDGSRASIT